jgi:glutamate synthase (NADPH/NADH) small chain
MDWHEVYEQQDVSQVQRQASRCMDCGIPFCHSGCPLGNRIPEWNDLAWKDDWPEAIEQLHATNNFPEFTGRLCPAPCETACVLGINQPAVTIKQIELTTIERAFDRAGVTPKAPDRLSGKTVAVVGSGPAGLAVAQQLTRAGHTVAVFERADKAGGLLRYGIPEFKMEKSVLDRRLAQMEAEGTRFRNGVDVGGDVTGKALRDRYDAVVLAVGATVPRDLPVPGRELDGVLQAMEFLPPANRVALGEQVENQVVATGKDVIVIGGGDTGADCIGTSHRQGAKSVTSLEIMPLPGEDRPGNQPWPTYPMLFRIAGAHEEGGERVYSVNTQEILGDEHGRVRALRLVEVERGDKGFDRARDPCTAGPACHGIPRTREERRGRPAGRRAGRTLKHQAGQRFHVIGAGCLRRRRRGPRPVADRLGHRRGPLRRGRCGRLSHGRKLPASAPGEPHGSATYRVT